MFHGETFEDPAVGGDIAAIQVARFAKIGRISERRYLKRVWVLMSRCRKDINISMDFVNDQIHILTNRCFESDDGLLAPAISCNKHRRFSNGSCYQLEETTASQPRKEVRR